MDEAMELWELCKHECIGEHSLETFTGEEGWCAGGKKVILEYVGLIVEHDGVRYRVAHIREED